MLKAFLFLNALLCIIATNSIESPDSYGIFKQVPWNTLCLTTRSDCYCNDNTNSITCYGYSSNKTFVDFSPINRSFSRVYLINYDNIPTAGFKDVFFNVTGKSLFFNVQTAYEIHANAFNPLGNLSATDVFDLEMLFVTPINLTVKDFAFNNTNIKKLTFSDIKLANGTYIFNLGAFYGAKAIESLYFPIGNSISNFNYKPNNCSNKTSCMVKIKYIETQSTKMQRFSNSTFGNQVFFANELEELRMIYGSIQTIDDYSFNEMKNLRSLILNGNKIKKVNAFSFHIDNNKLRTLDLSDNPIESIVLLAFDTLVNLTKLNLKGTQLIKIDDDLFTYLKSLEELDLSLSRNMTIFNWKSLLPLNNLKKVQLSYMNSKDVILREDFIKHNLSLINSLALRLEEIGVRGYNFTDNDACMFSLLKTTYKNQSLALFSVSTNHECNCFVIESMRYYRYQFTDMKEFEKGLTTAPNCYRTLYDIKNHPYLNRTSSEIKAKEAECISILDSLCSEIITESTHTSSITSTGTKQPTQGISTPTSTPTIIQQSSTITTSNLIQNNETSRPNSVQDTLLITTIVFASLSLILIVLLVIVLFKKRTPYQENNIKMKKYQENMQSIMI
jgi:uncharacterized protein YjbI with pentapeptide repeats